MSRTILDAPLLIESQKAGYASWGNVEVEKIYIRDSADTCWVNKGTRIGAKLSQEDIEQLTLEKASWAGEIFRKRPLIGCILITRQQYASQIREEIPPILDDQAQLLGVSIRVAEKEDKIIARLKGRFAAVLHDGRCICIGITLEDAWVAAQLLEKTSKAFIEARALGGAKSINRIEAWLMQKFYQLKYSKEAKKNV